MKQKLYLECYAGISGDMTVAALLDLGADADKLKRTLDSLKLEGYTICISRVKKSGLDACDFAVNLDAEHENHDHDMAYLHGDGTAAAAEGHVHGHSHSHEEHGHEHGHSHEGHSHEHGHSHEEHSHSHEAGHHHGHSHRGLPEILEILRGSEMTDRAKEIAERIFRILAEAEAKAHGVPMEQVHFHEVGAVDSIVDVAAAAICLDDLGIEEVIVPVLYEGCGYIRCQHGVIPVPVPATLHVVSAHHLRLHRTETPGEFVTPTGAAIAAAVCTSQELPQSYRVERIGLGAGKRNYERPSLLRAMLITPEDTERDIHIPRQVPEDCIVKLECSMDDCDGESMGYAMERLFEAGARDVNYIPVFMKKNRPAYLLTVICSPEDREKMEGIIFRETSTIGIRRQYMERSVLARENQKVPTAFGEMNIKTVERDGRSCRIPEYESVAEAARREKLPFRQVYQAVQAELNREQ